MSQIDEPAAAPPPSSSDSSATDAARMVRADLVAAIVFIALGLLILYGSWTMPRLEVRRIHPLTIPGIVPGILGAALTFCGALLAARSLRRGVRGGWKDLADAVTSEAARRALAVIALILVFTLGLVGWLPFWAATALFVFAFILIFELWITASPRPFRKSFAWALGLAVVTAVTVTLVFERLFLVRLP